MASGERSPRCAPKGWRRTRWSSSSATTAARRWRGRRSTARRNTPLRGSKRQTWEGGIRVPFIIRWKGRLPEGRVDARPIIQLDVLPTALAAAGVEPKADWKLDGVESAALPDRQAAGRAARRAVLAALRRHMAIRKGDWKLVKTMEGPLLDADTSQPDLSGAQLFNLAEDIGEKNESRRRPPGEGQGTGGRLAAVEQGDGKAALDAGRRRTGARGGAIHGPAPPALIRRIGEGQRRVEIRGRPRGPSGAAPGGLKQKVVGAAPSATASDFECTRSFS